MDFFDSYESYGIQDLIDELDAIAENRRYQTDTWLTSLCRFASLEEFSGCVHIDTPEERNLFQTLVAQLTNALGMTDSQLADQLQSLRELIILQDLYSCTDPAFKLELQKYFQSAVAEAAAEQSKVSRNIIARLEQEQQDFRSALAAKEETIRQLREQLEHTSFSKQTGDEQLKADYDRLKKAYETVVAERNALQAQVQAQSQPMTEQKPQPAAPKTVSQSPDKLYYLMRDRLYDEDMHPLEFFGRQCPHVQTLVVFAPMAITKETLSPFPNLDTLSLSPDVTRLELDALSACSNVRLIVFAKPDCSIEEQPDRLRAVTLCAPAGGQVEAYARKHGICFDGDTP